MDWKKLKKNKCPKCGGDLTVTVIRNRPKKVELVICTNAYPEKDRKKGQNSLLDLCDFRIGTVRFHELIKKLDSPYRDRSREYVPEMADNQAGLSEL